MKRSFNLPAIVLLALTGHSAGAQSAPAPYHLLNTIVIGGEGGWDYLNVDPVGKRLYLSHGTQVEVVD